MKWITFEEWAGTVPQSICQDPLWRFQVYPKALYLFELAWQDCAILIRDPRGRAIAEQLIRSAGSICANIEEGYGRGYGKEFSYFLRIAIGSARESRGWYYRAHHLLPREVLEHRLALLDEIIAMLAPNIERQRRYRRQS
ncbi:MAG: four helix bundle protein [Thermoflexales bacterium]|nr:four helix bundle protein [Thermoflexales bacterium]